jgi:hypothetical protein
MQTTIDTKIQEGQVWRNKEKGYTITVLSKLKKGVWKVSAHGKGRTTHRMTENSFHFYDLISEDTLKPTTKEEKMNINNRVRLIFNNNLSINHIFSVDDIVNSLTQIDDLKDFKKEKLKASVSAFISSCLKTKAIKKLSDKMKVSTSKKVYQKLDNSYAISKKIYLTTNANINGGLFKKVFNEQLEINQMFTTIEFMQKTINTINCGELDKKEINIVNSRVYSFINKYVKKGYIEKMSETSRWIKLKYIDNIEIQPEKTQEIKVEINVENKFVEEKLGLRQRQHISEKDVDQAYSENKLSNLLEKFSMMPMGELVESFILHFNILQEKEKLQRKTIEVLESKIENIESVNIDSLKETLKTREDKIITLNREVCNLKDKVKQLDSDVNHQLDENERLLTINKELNSKVEVTEPTDAWKTINVGDAISVN